MSANPADPAPPSPASPPPAALRPALERAALCRCLSLLFQTPSAAQQEEVAALVPSLPPWARRAAPPPALTEAARDGLAAEYHRLLGAAGVVRDAESDYEVNALGGKGPLIADVAGFYRAFAYEEELHESPDHVAVELGFLGWLSLKEAAALHGGATADAAVCADARATFVREHLGRYVTAFTDQLEGYAGAGFYADAARLLATAVARETAAFPHAAAPAVADPEAGLAT